MNRKLALAGLALLALVQWAVPAAMIHGQQKTLAEGEVYRFRNAPVDPADPFRGRYVTLSFDAACVPKDVAHGDMNARPLYALLGQDVDGYATVARLSDSRPGQGDYVNVRRSRWDSGCLGSELRVDFPFNRYYLPEDLAPRAESAYRDMTSRSSGEVGRVAAYVGVRVREGHAALEELYLDGKPLRQFLAEEARRP